MVYIRLSSYIKFTIQLFVMIAIANTTIQAKSISFNNLSNNTIKTVTPKNALKQLLGAHATISLLEDSGLELLGLENNYLLQEQIQPTEKVLDKDVTSSVGVSINSISSNIPFDSEKTRVLFKIPAFKMLLGKTHVQRYRLLNPFYVSYYPNAQKYSFELEQLFIEMKAFAKLHQDQGMRDEVEFLFIYYKLGTLSGDARIDFMESTYQKAMKDGTPWKVFLSKWYLGQLLINLNTKVDVGLYLLTEASEMLENGFEHPLASYLNYTLGNTNYRYSDMESAKKYFKRAIVYDDASKNKSNLSRCYNELGLIYRKLNRLDSSNVYLKKALGVSLVQHDSIMAGIISGNLGENHYLRGNYDKAIPLLKMDADIAMLGEETGLASNALLLLADCYLMKGDMDKTAGMLALGKAYTYKSKEYHRLQRLYPILSKWYAVKGEAELASMYVDSTRFVIDSLERLQMLVRVVPSEELYEVSGLKIEKAQQKVETTQRKLIIAVMAIVLLLSVVLILVYRMVSKQKQDQLSTENTQLKSDLLIAQQKLDAFILSKRVSEVNTASMVDKPILTHEDLQRFKVLFDAAYLGFRHRLKSKFPSLTETEMQVLCFLKLNLSNKEISGLLGVGVNAVQQQKRRARLKLCVTSSIELNDLAHSI